MSLVRFQAEALRQAQYFQHIIKPLKMKYFVYILLCDKKTFYVGVASDLDKRVSEHKNKLSFFTKKFSDIELVYKEDYVSLKEARRREKQLKGWSIAKKKALIDGNKSLLVSLSRSN